MLFPIAGNVRFARVLWIILPVLVLFSGLLYLLRTPSVHAQQTPRQVDAPDIIGGSEATPGAWPWQVALVNSRYGNDLSGQYCGGALIDPEWVLTAAHCASPNMSTNTQAVLGKHKLSVQDGEHISITDVIIHPEYNGQIGSADLALLRLSQPSTRTVLPLDLAVDGKVEARAVQAMVIGWGQTEQGPSNVLRQVTLPFFSHERCRDIYTNFPGSVSPVTDGMVCAGYENGGKSACFGDSGGPLMIPIAAAPGWKQVGIVSWGSSSCASPERPNVYTRISTYQPWIADCLLDHNGRICAGWDANEPDNSPAEAHPLLMDSPAQTLTLATMSDTDWFQFAATAGQNYRFMVVVSDTMPADVILWLYDSDGRTALAYADSYRPDYTIRQGDREFLRWQAPHNGAFYLQVESRWLGRRLTYQISGVTNATDLFLPIIAQFYLYPGPTPIPVPTAIPGIQTLPVVKTPEP
ncbi:MAG: hypothetical protein DYG89_48160 [Caldilinea sp. CFX5]|nr:hypothetical protein [Caldilinea sp. CFX5]